VMDATEGCTVRWVDPNDFHMINVGQTGSAQLFLHTDAAGDTPYMITPAGLQLYVRKHMTAGADDGTSGKIAWISQYPSTHSPSSDWRVFTVQGQLFNTISSANAIQNSTDFLKQNLPFIVIEGLQPGQQVTVQASWHLEYEPNSCALGAATPSYVDPGFNSVILPILGDRASFPIVVKGHSFFKSLSHALRKASGFMAKMMKTASTVAALHPDPRFQAASVGFGAAGTAFQAAST